MEQLKFKLDSFEGPLDLLLMLIRKNKVSIYDIPISLILDQYLAVMNEMKEMDLEISSEFLVLAATLLQTEYKKVKESIGFFKERENIGTSMFYKSPDAIERPPAELNYATLTPENLLLAYRRAYQRLERKTPPPKQSFRGIVGHEKVSIRSRVAAIWHKLKTKTATLFKDLFSGVKNRPEAVASFLASLELIKLNKIKVEYDESGDISNPKVFRTDDNDFDFNIIED